MKRKIISAIGIGLSAAVFAVSAFMLINENVRLHNDKKTFDDLASLVLEETPSDTPNNASASLQTPDVATSDTSTDSAPSESQSPEINRNMALLDEMNSDTFGWIYIEGTTVNYPVMHSPDEPERYLRRNFYKNYSVSGTPFLDARCLDSSSNLIIYGHNMKNGTMFSNLISYSDINFAKSHPVCELEYGGSVHKYEIYCAARINRSSEVYSFTDGSAATFDAFLNVLSNAAYYTASDTPTYGERLLTLSTCTQIRNLLRRTHKPFKRSLLVYRRLGGNLRRFS